MDIKRFLARNNFIMEQTFVAMIMALSKIIGPDKFPCGIYEWPPSKPDVARSQGSGNASSSSSK